ncbi:uncharacterized protein LOC112344483 [Selaginella moellendorffii]|uniref:uncharacterized protein LOC112344483 n=1 Tax=Selaginella moellendorffii TaxID=88036 RepID=UPI000D1D03B4|nr:uncharacterized protein LOC112344483 [Selaginella moellendorffii]|eukprot:XP_024525133.1 uncharacterized protein LOC112344483 [Selaginella moellendorffii]
MQRKPKPASGAGFGVVPPYQPNIVPRVKIWFPPAFTAKYKPEPEPAPAEISSYPSKKRDFDTFAQDAEVCSFQGEDIGGYPPRAEEILLFQDLKRRRGERFTLKDIEEDENAKVLAEKEMRNFEGFSRPRPPEAGKGPPAISLSIDLFDNPEIDLKHPSTDIQEAQERGEKGAKARARFYASTGLCEWVPCYVLEYDRKNDTYLVEFTFNEKRKVIKRLSFILDRERERAFVARVFAAKDLRTRVETQMFSAIPRMLRTFHSEILK